MKDDWVWSPIVGRWVTENMNTTILDREKIRLLKGPDFPTPLLDEIIGDNPTQNSGGKDEAN